MAGNVLDRIAFFAGQLSTSGVGRRRNFDSRYCVQVGRFEELFTILLAGGAGRVSASWLWREDRPPLRGVRKHGGIDTPMSACTNKLRVFFVWSYALLLGSAFFFVFAFSVFAFVASLASAALPGENSSGVFLPSNRQDARGIQRAKEFISKGEFSQAIRFLDKVLAREEDSFVVLPIGSSYESKRSKENQEEIHGEGRSLQLGEYGGGYHGESGGGLEQKGEGKGNSPDSQAPKPSEQSAARSGHTGLKETARKILRDLPPEGRRIYETTFGPVARRLLKQSLESGDFLQLRQITRRYFYTPAGHEAALLFAQHESDEGRHLTAALTYQQLLETPEAAARFQPQLSILAAASWLAAENSGQAGDVLESLGEQGHRSITLAGEESRLRASPADKVEWLRQTVGSPVVEDIPAERQWLTSRGNPARNGQTDGGLPHLRVRWQVRLLEHHNLEAVHDEMAGLLAQQAKSRLPAASPLVAGDYVITRSAHGLIAIDFQTGKRIWRAQPQRATLLRELMELSDQQNGNKNGNRNNNIEPAQSFGRMLWEDYLYNTTSSDGKRVYVIRDLELPRSARVRVHAMMPQTAFANADRGTNRLCAYDLPTQGKLVWEIDGAARSDELQGAFFLGAPVTVGQSLYCLAEIKSETAIYLVVLDRRTGKLQWRQQLADLEIGIARDVNRRLQASMPSYDEGMLVCPTNAGVVIGVNLAKQSLAWAYRYESHEQLALHRRRPDGYGQTAHQRWVHSTPVIADGRVLLTPSESDELHCLDLQTGKLLWKQSREESLFLAGIENDKVLLVGNRELSALLLANGKPAWPAGRLELPAESTPTGSGFFSKGQYFLPLSNAQVIAVDVATGKIVDKARSRDGQLLGNLVCYHGAVISQTGRYLDCFEQIDVLREDSERRLAADPTDFEALRTLGEMAYNEGQLAQAVKLLSQAYKSQPEDLRTREVLGEALVAALDEEFAEYQSYLPLLAQIQQGSAEERFTLMRLQSQGLLEIGRASEAFEVCLKAYDDLAILGTELTIGQDHQVSAQRWLAAQVAAVWASASSAQQEQIAEQFRPLLAETRQVADARLWQQLYDCFGSLESTESLGADLATGYLDQGEWLAAQQLLLKLTKSEKPSVRHTAIASSSRLLHEAARPFLAASYDKQLRGTLADEECLAGKTGAECLEDWASSGNSSTPSWPYGQVKVSVEDSRAASGAKRNPTPHSGIYLEQSDAILSDCNVTLLGMVSGRNRMVAVRDSLGREFFRAKLDQGEQRRMNAQGTVYSVSRGNLLIVSLGREIVAYDTLSPDGQILWRKDTTSNLHHLNQNWLNRNSLNQHKSSLRGKFGRPRSRRSHSNGKWLGLIGPVTRDSCVFQVEQQLVCVDALSGETKWSQDNFALGSDLFGDEEYVFAVPEDSQHAWVFSTVDGRSLGETAHELPAWEERLTTVGRQIIRWHRRATDRRWELSSFDALSGEELWKFEFAKNSQADISQNRFVAVAEPTGHCMIIDVHEGRALVDQPLEANVAMSGVSLIAGAESFVLAVQQPPVINRSRPVTPINGNGIDFTTKVFAGQMYAFDRKTGLANWDHPAEVQGLPLMLTQPVDLPMIAFAGNIQRQRRSRSKAEMGIMLLEKSSGRLLFHDETLPQSTHHFFLRASEEQTEGEMKGELSEAIVEMSTRKIKLQFTGHPRAPEPSARHDVQRKVGSRAGGLQKIGAKIFGGG